MKLLAKIIIVAAIFVAGFYFGTQQALSPTSNLFGLNKSRVETPKEEEQTPQGIMVDLMLDFGNGQVKTFSQVNLPEDSTVFDLLKKVTTENNLSLESKDYGSMGVFIESIGEAKSDLASDKFWQYWVNNKYSQMGSSSYKLKSGDLVEWKFTKGQIN